MTTGRGIWRLDISIPAPAVPAFEAALAELGGAIATDAPEAGVAEARANVGLQVYLDAEPGRPHLTALLAGAALLAGVTVPEARVERLPEVDWVTESHRALPAIQAGPFYIHGAHVEEPAPPGAIAILIEAGSTLIPLTFIRIEPSAATSPGMPTSILIEAVATTAF